MTLSGLAPPHKVWLAIGVLEDAFMDYFAENCVFYMPRGGDRYVGKNQVRAGLSKRFEGIPNVCYGEDQHWVCDDFGVSE
jgi:hypothetical protein